MKYLSRNVRNAVGERSYSHGQLVQPVCPYTAYSRSSGTATFEQNKIPVFSSVILQWINSKMLAQL